MSRRLLLGLAAIAVTSPLSAQVPATPIAGTRAVLADGFSNVVGVQELADGRVVVADAKERLLRIGDFRSGTVTQLSRTGAGPTEYQSVSALFRTAGDTITMFDFPSRRVLLIAPNGTVAGTRAVELSRAPLPDETDLGNRIVGGTRYIDAAGVHYSEIQYLEPGKGVLPGGSFIVAGNPGTGVTRRAAPMQSWYPEKTTRWRAPFMYGDVWTVAPDGRVARVVPTDYHVEWYRDGRLLAKGPPVAVPPIPVSKADRDAWYAARAARGAASGRVSGPPSPPASPPAGARPAFRPYTDADFPDHKPPFLEEYVGRAATIAPDGRLWVTRVTEHGKAPLVDVFDDKGALVRRVTLPASTRIAGFGKDAVYLVRTDDDGLQWVERYRE